MTSLGMTVPLRHTNQYEQQQQQYLFRQRAGTPEGQKPI